MKVYLLIDIGGTNVRLVLLESISNNKAVVWEKRVATQIGVTGLKKQCEELYSRVRKKVADLDLKLIAVSIGFPANLSLDKAKSVIKGSALNISVKENEWAGISMQAYFEAIFSDLPVFVINDALAQCWGGLKEKGLQGRLKYKDTVVYLGMGTGLGGACCYLGKNLEPNFFTDGHIYDIWIEGPKGKCIAEDWLSGRGVFAYTGFSAEELAKVENQASENYWRRLGQDLNQLMQIIQSGEIKKRDTRWETTDQLSLKQVDLWVLGASFVKESKARDLWFSQLNKTENIYLLEEPDQAAMVGLKAHIQL